MNVHRGISCISSVYKYQPQIIRCHRYHDNRPFGGIMVAAIHIWIGRAVVAVGSSF